jgi:hypothetical protein
MTERQERARLYAGARWKSVRREVLRQQPLCFVCQHKATVVDHVAGHGHGWRERFFAGPFRSMCWPCHSRKTSTTEQTQGGTGFKRAGTPGVGGRVSSKAEGSLSTHKGIANILGQAKVGSAEAFAQKLREKWQQESSSTKE